MTNLEKVYLDNKVVYKEPLTFKTDSQGKDYGIERECYGFIEEVSIRNVNGNIIKDVYFYTDKKLLIDTLFKYKTDKTFLKITDIIKLPTRNFCIFVYAVKKA